MCVLLIKVPIRKKSGNLFNEPCIYKVNVIILLLLRFTNDSFESFLTPVA